MQTAEQAKKAGSHDKPKSNSSLPPALFGEPTTHYVLYLACTADGILLPLDEHGKISVLNPRISTKIEDGKNTSTFMYREMMRLARDAPFSLEIYPERNDTPNNEMCTDLDEGGRAAKVFHTYLVHGKTSHYGDFVLVPYEKLMLDKRIADGTTLQILQDLSWMDYFVDTSKSETAPTMQTVHQELADLSAMRDTYIVAMWRKNVLLGSTKDKDGIIWTLQTKHLHQRMQGVTEAVAERLMRKLGGYKTMELCDTILIGNTFVDIYVAELKDSWSPSCLELRSFTEREVRDMNASNGSPRLDEITKKILLHTSAR